MARKLHIDGTQDGSYISGAGVAPFAVFDEDQQDNLIAGLRFRWMAVAYRWIVLRWRG